MENGKNGKRKLIRKDKRKKITVEKKRNRKEILKYGKRKKQ